MSNQACGDSITVGVGASPGSSAYIPLLACDIGAITNNAVSSSQAGNQAIAAYSIQPQGGDRFTVMLGSNDFRKYKADSVKQNYFKGALRGLLAWLATPEKATVGNGGLVLTGSWVTFPAYTLGRKTTQQGAKATAVVSGESVYVTTIVQDSTSVRGTANVKVDGQLVGTLNCDGTGCGTFLGTTYMPWCLRIDGLSPGQHTVEVEVTSNNTIFYIDWIGGSDQLAKPSLFASNLPKQSNAQYAADGTSDALLQTYNGFISDIVSALSSDGVDIHLVDSYTPFNQATDLSDGVHPNNSGHLKIKDAFLQVINNQPQVINYPMASGNTLEITLINSLVTAYQEIA